MVIKVLFKGRNSCLTSNFILHRNIVGWSNECGSCVGVRYKSGSSKCKRYFGVGSVDCYISVPFNKVIINMTNAFMTITTLYIHGIKEKRFAKGRPGQQVILTCL